MITIRSLIDSAQIPTHEAEQLVLGLLNRDRTWLFTHGAEASAGDSLPMIREAIARRCTGEPLAYILGSRSFWNLELKVTPAVLIPRPDTELLVEWAIDCVVGNQLSSCADLGTGSGAVALAIKSEVPHCAVTGVDRSRAALEVAQYNSIACNLTVEWLQSDWFGSLEGRLWPLLVGNPPYIADSDPHLKRGDLPAEPTEALVAGPDGYRDLRHLIAIAPRFLTAGGYLLLEHGWNQGAEVRELFARAGFGGVATRRDLGGHERVTGGYKGDG